MRFKNKKVAVLGFGMEGADLVSYLLSQGADVSIFDQKTKGDLKMPKSLLEKVRLIPRQALFIPRIN
jgi:UDP-N-acetylmuramoylalanine-D-glutamate ligase